MDTPSRGWRRLLGAAKLSGLGPCLALSGPVLAFSVACGDEDRPGYLGDAAPIEGCERFSYKSCDILSAACQRELFELMACIRGEPADTASPPPVALLDEAAAVDRIAAVSQVDASGEDDGDFGAQMRAYELLALTEPGLIQDASDIVSVTVASVVAFYLIPTREIVIIDRGDPVDDLDANATLAHEFVHSMQDVRHGLARFGGSVAGSDAALAASAVTEGEASVYQLLMMLAYEGVPLAQVDYDSTFDNLARLGAELTLETASPMITASGIFPYTVGARYAAWHWQRGELEALDALYAEPPRTSLEVMLAGRSGPLPPLRVFDTAPDPLPAHELVVDDVVGAWVTFAVLGGLAADAESPAALQALATRWRGDHVWAYRSDDEPAAVAALWISAWENAESAESVARALRLWAPDGGVLEVNVADDVVRVVAVERASDLEGWVARLGAVPAR